jgi:hypothetical protein
MFCEIKSLIAVLMLLFGVFMALMGMLGLIYGEFYGPANSIFNLVSGQLWLLEAGSCSLSGREKN